MVEQTRVNQSKSKIKGVGKLQEQYISLSDLRKVSGIGNKTIERVKCQIDKTNESKNILEGVLQIQPPSDFKVPLNDVYCGESIEFMRKNIPDNSIDMVLTSPPYDNLRDYNGYGFDYKTMLGEIYRVLKDGGTCVWVVGDETISGSETGTSFKQALYAKEVGFNLHDTMIYQKSNPMPLQHNRYQPCFEYMFVFSKGKPVTFNPIMEDTVNPNGKLTITQREKDGSKNHGTGYGSKRNSKRYKHNIWKYNVGKNQTTNDEIAFHHPAIFPEQLAEDHIVSWSNEGDIILDPMCGSGTTCKMAKLNNRNFIGIDISEEYVDISKERLRIT